MRREEKLVAATQRYKAALADFQAATTLVIEAIRAGKRVTKDQFEREANARKDLLMARELVARLSRKQD